MKLRDVWAYGSNDFSDIGWGCTYRTLQAMHNNLLKEQPPTTLTGITDKIEGKNADKKDWLEPTDTKVYFEKIMGRLSPLKMKLFKSFRHQKWRNEKRPCGELEKYEDVEEMKEFLAAYFTEERAAAGNVHMMMFDDGCSNFGVYGYKDGEVYVMDPHDWSGKYMMALTEEQLDSTYEPPQREFHCLDDRDPQENFAPLLHVNIEKFDILNFCILTAEKEHVLASCHTDYLSRAVDAKF